MNSNENHRVGHGGIRWLSSLRQVAVASAVMVVVSATAVPRAEGAGEQACCNLSTSDRRCFDDIIASGSTCSSPATGLGKGTTCVNDCDCDTVCDDCAGKQAGNLSHVEIMHLGTSFNGTNTKFTYRVCQIEGAALSHWVLGLSNVCCNRIVGATGGTTTGTCGTDPTTGLFGLKFETGSGVTSCSGTCGSAGTIFTITISGNVGDTGCVKTANKADGAEDTSTACIRGPDATCSEGNACDPPPDCSPFNTECTTFSCDPNGSPGNCSVATNDPSGTPCEADGDLCTNDACNASGMCVFVSDKNALCPGPTEFCDGGSKCNPATGACEANPDKPFSTVCERDGNLCTNDHCDGLGHCMLLSDKNATCAPAAPPCESGQTCDPADGVCKDNVDTVAGTSCEADGDLCTIDHCDGFGNCVNFDNVMCAVAVPPCEGGAVCDPATGACVDQPDAAFSTFCERGDPLNLCTRDHCDGNGNCVLLSNVVCQGSSQCDPGENCDPATGNCVMKADVPPFSTPCEEDGDLCTIEHCDGAGSCIFKEPVVCPPPTGFCDGGTNCDPATGACSIPKPDRPFSTPCERDGNLCTNDHCDGMGKCVFLSDKNATCQPDTTCQTFDCDPATGMCVGTPAAQSTPCEADSPPDLCRRDHCDGTGNCVFLSDVMCSPPLGPCDSGENCNPATGLCEDKPDRDFSTPCERGDPQGLCSTDHCDGVGNCVFLQKVTCDPAVPPCEGGANCDPLTGTCVDKDDAPLSTFCESDADVCTRQHCDGMGNCVLEKEICGACCDGNTGLCRDGVFETECLNVNPCDQNTWHQALDCSEIPPPGCVRECPTLGITCPPDRVFECDAVGDFGNPTIKADCSVNPMVVCTEDSTPGKLPQERTIIRTCTVTNDCGNSAQCQQRIDIVDTTPPVVTCPSDCTLECGDVQCVPPECNDPTCECGGVATCVDNCSTCTVSVTCEVIPEDCTAGQVAGITPPPKLTVIRTFSATDATAAVTATGQGNIGTCVQRIELVDTTPPVLDAIFCPGTITICVGDDLAFTPPTCTDTCGTCSVICVRSDNQALPGPPPSGPITVTCVSTDECDNESSCTIDVELSESGECFVVIPTVSEWGLVVLTLLLLTGAKIFFGRRQVDAA